jgi:hypothetical protein
MLNTITMDALLHNEPLPDEPLGETSCHLLNAKI